MRGKKTHCCLNKAPHDAGSVQHDGGGGVDAVRRQLRLDQRAHQMSGRAEPLRPDGVKVRRLSAAAPAEPDAQHSGRSLGLLEGNLQQVWKC